MASITRITVGAATIPLMQIYRAPRRSKWVRPDRSERQIGVVARLGSRGGKEFTNDHRKRITPKQTYEDR